MDFKEAKRVIAYARKHGIKSLKLADLEITFHDAVIFPSSLRKPREASAPEAAVKDTIPAPAPEPTLQEIQNWIHQADEAH